MNIKLASALGAAILLASAAQPALAQRNAAAASAAPIVPGLGVANIDAIRVNSNAYRAADTQRNTDYAAVIQQAQTRAQQLDAQLAPMADAIRRAQSAPNANQAAIAQQITQFQTLQQNGQQEVQRMLLPVELSKAYVDEQIGEKLTQAVELAVAQRRISLLIPPDVILHADNAYNMNQPILDQLNILLPTAQINPPPGWLPRQLREQQAQQAAAAAGQQPGAAPAAAPAAPAGPPLPDGR
jgi:Skp family chaperone for outer membrane proteins